MDKTQNESKYFSVVLLYYQINNMFSYKQPKADNVKRKDGSAQGQGPGPRPISSQWRVKDSEKHVESVV